MSLSKAAQYICNICDKTYAFNSLMVRGICAITRENAPSNVRHVQPRLDLNVIQNFVQHVSAYIRILYICIPLRPSLFRIILIPNDIFQILDIRTSVSQFFLGISVSSLPLSFCYILPSKNERTFPFFGIFLYIWKIIASNRNDLAVYSSDALLLSNEYFGDNLSFDWIYCVSKALLLCSYNITQVLSL